MTKPSADFLEINAALDEMEVERLKLGFWMMFAQGLLMRADSEFARQIADQLIKAIQESAQEKGLRNKAHIQDALIEFGREVNKELGKRGA